MAEARPTERLTIDYLESLPDDPWHRYELIDGELYVAALPRIEHQATVAHAVGLLGAWSYGPDLGHVPIGHVLIGPGIIFSRHDSVIPDVAWFSRARRAIIEQDDGYLHGAPELVIEVLSPGATNERRDLEIKLGLYSRQGVDEYWVLDWRAQTVAVYRQRDGQLQLAATLGRDDTLTSPLLPGFAAPVAGLFPRR